MLVYLRSRELAKTVRHVLYYTKCFWDIFDDYYLNVNIDEGHYIVYWLWAIINCVCNVFISKDDHN